MSRIEETVVTFRCDLCNVCCGDEDRDVEIQVTSGDGRDVGPGFLSARFRVDLPYAVSNGHTCRRCLIEKLTKFVELERRRGGGK